jgi:CTP synthase
VEKHLDERHRHRYEVNPVYINRFEAAGLKFVGKDESGERMEVIENSKHPFFVAAQFHPEFKSRPFKASPLFLVSLPFHPPFLSKEASLKEFDTRRT